MHKCVFAGVCGSVRVAGCQVEPCAQAGHWAGERRKSAKDGADLQSL